MAVRLRFCCLIVPWHAIERYCAGGVRARLAERPLEISMGTEWADEQLLCVSTMSMHDTLDERARWVARGLPEEWTCIVHYRSDPAALGVDWLGFERREEYAFVWLQGTEPGTIYGPDEVRPPRIPLAEPAH